MNKEKVSLMELPKIADDRGSITFIEWKKHIPFEANRIFYIYDVPKGKERGAHAHKKCRQIFISLNGAFDVLVDDGHEKISYRLMSPSQGLYVPNGMWVELKNMFPGAVALVLCSETYDETDYIRDYDIFQEAKANDTGV